MSHTKSHVPVIDLTLDKGWGAHVRVTVANTEAADKAAQAFLARVTHYEVGQNYHVAHVDYDAMGDGVVLGEALTDFFHPVCEHGLSLQLCAGPQHYPYDDEERQARGF